MKTQLFSLILGISLFLQFSCQPSSVSETNDTDPFLGFATEVIHPLDAITGEELLTVINILKEDGKYTDSLTFLPEVSLMEPDKSEVYNWKKGDPISRKAQILSREGGQVFEGVVDISHAVVSSWEEVKDIQPSIIFDDFMKADQVWRTDERVISELEKRGYDIEQVTGYPLSPGYFGEAESRDKRLLKVWLADISNTHTNRFAKPINGIIPVIELTEEKVIEVYLTGDDARNEVSYEYDDSSIEIRKSKPVQMISPEGDNYSYEDGMLNWNDWKFHMRMEKRQGLIISMASFKGQSVAYQLSANEMFVPYMDPAKDWSYRSYMDVGEYGFGFSCTPLAMGADVPGNASLLSTSLPTDNGTPLLLENVIGVFERNTGRPNWRHVEAMSGTAESRPEIELVVRTIPTVGNYDYVLDYVFSDKGIIKVDVGATGINAVKAAKAKSMEDATALYETKVGNLVAPNLVGVYHDHFISFRIDLDIDGQDNTILTDEVIPVTYKDNVRKSGWEIVEHPNLIEGAVSNEKDGHDGFYRVVNKNSKNSLGQHKGYQILGHSHLSPLPNDEYPQKRAAWSGEQLWVTPYDKDELFPSGKYPNQSDGSDGILNWTAQKRSIDNTDIVCWYTVGFHHVTLPEDWPVLPTKWHSFMLRPAMSFDRNPALEVSK
ncbi:MAG: hypothetical protein AAGC85_14480 [Bacteroidota bacterium]